MRKGEVILDNIASDMLQTTYAEVVGHHTLGHEIGVGHEANHNAATLPVGAKIFVKSGEQALRDDPLHDAVGMILGHNGDKVNVITLSPKHSDRWGIHNAYGETHSEVPDALAALDRLFDPEVEFGSVAVLSEATGNLLGASAAATVGEAGCNSHESTNIATTLSLSQLLDNYAWRAVSLHANSHLLRRDNEGEIIHLLPGQVHADQPNKEQRDQRGMLDRIQRLASPESKLHGLSEVAILRGIETAVGSGVFNGKQNRVESVADVIQKGAERLII